LIYKAGCTIRMPIEVIKQRAQATRRPSLLILKSTYNESGVRGLYRGYLTTVCREIPFAVLQFPIWEQLKKALRNHRQKESLTPIESAGCGAISGAIAGALTTPMDVAKTRIILAERHDPTSSGNMLQVIRSIYLKEGLAGQVVVT
jgi:solute carrier family 25 S-adenosylmethionine transporter 26